MCRGGYNLGGEQSRQLIFLDQMTARDGIIAALQVLTLIHELRQPLSELATVMQPYPQVLVHVKVQHRHPLDSLAEMQRLQADIEQKLGRDGRVLLRYSGTEPKAWVMVEGPEAALITGYAQQLAASIVAGCGAG